MLSLRRGRCNDHESIVHESIVHDVEHINQDQHHRYGDYKYWNLRHSPGESNPHFLPGPIISSPLEMCGNV
jgi:hypothetical protein